MGASGLVITLASSPICARDHRHYLACLSTAFSGKLHFRGTRVFGEPALSRKLRFLGTRILGETAIFWETGMMFGGHGFGGWAWRQ